MVTLSKDQFPKESLCSFNYSLYSEFIGKYGEDLDKMSQYGAQAEFSAEIRVKMSFYNKNVMVEETESLEKRLNEAEIACEKTNCDCVIS